MVKSPVGLYRPSSAKQYKRREMYIVPGYPISVVFSYKTYIGWIDYEKAKFYTFGYGRYSTTTSKQITMLCREKRLERVDITPLDFPHLSTDDLLDLMLQNKE